MHSRIAGLEGRAVHDVISSPPDVLGSPQRFPGPPLLSIIPFPLKSLSSSLLSSGPIGLLLMPS